MKNTLASASGKVIKKSPAQAGGDVKPGTDLNELLERALQLVGVPPSAIVRCDELPVVRVNEEGLEVTFIYLLRFLFSHHPESESFLLHVKVEQVTTDFIDMVMDKEDTVYRISFHTNRMAQGSLFSKEEADFCSRCLSDARGAFTVNTKPSSGWLFILEVPGKLIK